MTVNLTDKYGVTIIKQSQSKSHYIAIGRIFERSTMITIHSDIRAEGRTWPTASSRAIAEAERWVAINGA